MARKRRNRGSVPLTIRRRITYWRPTRWQQIMARNNWRGPGTRVTRAIRKYTRR
jgi:hypothetical protein